MERGEIEQEEADVFTAESSSTQILTSDSSSSLTLKKLLFPAITCVVAALTVILWPKGGNISVPVIPDEVLSDSLPATLRPQKRSKINGHEYVDLGLSVKWSTCNVGASSPSDYGNYYAWGETKTKSDYSEDTYEYYNGENIDIGSNISGTIYDAARSNWGGTWRLPTLDEIKELWDECIWRWTSQNGVNGYKVTGKNGSSIFLPAAGFRDGESLYDAGSYGYYWSATPYSDIYYTYGLFFDSSGYDWIDDYRGYGRAVRPVSE